MMHGWVWMSGLPMGIGGGLAIAVVTLVVAVGVLILRELFREMHHELNRESDRETASNVPDPLDSIKQRMRTATRNGAGYEHHRRYTRGERRHDSNWEEF